MNQYYLLSQLPSLEGYGESGELPITEAELYELCSRFLDNKAMQILSELSLTPKKDSTSSGSSFVDEWNRAERQLRYALASVRASRMNKPFEQSAVSVPLPLMQVANTAVNMSSPLSAEQYLSSYRLSVLDRLRPLEQFSEDVVYCYALRLKLLERIRLFNAEGGRKAYEKIYNSILNNSEQEN